MSKATESWADWILSSYSESINQPPAEVLPQHLEDSSSDTTTTTTTSSSTDTSPDTTSSPWGPYTKTGRGGYGNFQWQSDNDIEAKHHHHQPSVRSNSHHTSTITTTTSSTTEPSSKKRRPANILTGRGGAGNTTAGNTNVPATYTPGMTPRSPTWPISPNNHSPPPPASSTTTISIPRSASAVYGRGGAGNFAASSLALAATAKEEKMEEERRRVAEDLYERAEHDVEGMLRPPEDAFLAGARRRESGVGVVV